MQVARPALDKRWNPNGLVTRGYHFPKCFNSHARLSS